MNLFNLVFKFIHSTCLSNRWAYVEFPTSKEGQEFIDTYRGKKDDERPKMDGDNFIISVINNCITLTLWSLLTQCVLFLFADETLRVGTLQHIGRLYVEVKKKEDKEKEKEKCEAISLFLSIFVGKIIRKVMKNRTC